MTPDDFRAWRQRLGLSQSRAAEALGMKIRQIQKYEAGEAAIPRSISLACKAIALGLSE